MHVPIPRGRLSRVMDTAVVVECGGSGAVSRSPAGWHVVRCPAPQQTVPWGPTAEAAGRCRFPDTRRLRSSGVSVGRRLSTFPVPVKDLHQYDHLHVCLRNSGVDSAQQEWVACQLGVCKYPRVEQDQRVEKAECPDRGAPAARSYPLVLHHSETRLYCPSLRVPFDVFLRPVCGKSDVHFPRAFPCRIPCPSSCSSSCALL